MKTKEEIIKEAHHLVDMILMTEDEHMYHKLFRSVLSKFGVKSPSHLSPDKKKMFFNNVKRQYSIMKGKKSK
jgi:hypothetical protein